MEGQTPGETGMLPVIDLVEEDYNEKIFFFTKYNYFDLAVFI